jgi:hypothetical protein
MSSSKINPKKCGFNFFLFLFIKYKQMHSLEREVLGLRIPNKHHKIRVLTDSQTEEMNSNEARHTYGLAKGSEAYKSKVLPEDFVLSEYDVICGRGSRCFNHIGNQRFRELVQQYLDRYSSIASSSSKTRKNAILCEVVNIVRSRSPKGGFVKKKKTNGRYVEVGDFLAVCTSLL